MKGTLALLDSADDQWVQIMRHFFRIHAICDYFRIQEQSCFIPLISFKVKIPIHYMIYLKFLNQDNNSTV